MTQTRRSWGRGEEVEQGRGTAGDKDCAAGEGRGRWSWPARVWFTFLTHSYSHSEPPAKMGTQVQSNHRCAALHPIYTFSLPGCFSPSSLLYSCPLLHGTQRQDEWEAKNWPRTSLHNRESSSVSLWASYLWDFTVCRVLNKSSYNSLWKQPVIFIPFFNSNSPNSGERKWSAHPHTFDSPFMTISSLKTSETWQRF